MTRVYKVYNWVVKRRRDKEFVAAWQAYSRWVVKQEGSTGSTRLFRDTLDPAHFMSVDAWDDEKVYESLQAGVEFGHRHYGLEQLSENFSSWTLKLESEQRT